MSVLIDQSENKYRAMSACAGCKKSKEIGLVVCWDCFKYRDDVIPFKYHNGSIESWLEIVWGVRK